MKNIVVYDTALCTSNLGDEIILSAVEDRMRDIFDSGMVMRLGTHVANFSAAQMLKNGLKVKYAKSADWKFICGTNLLAQKMIGKLNAQWQLNYFNSSIYTGCVLIGVGAMNSGEKLDWYAKSLYKRVLSPNYMHSVRDEQTKRIVESLGFRAINTGCPTLWKLTPDFCKQIPHSKAPNAIISVSGHQQQQNREYDKKIIEIVKRNYDKVWAWIQTTEDEKYLSTINGSEGIERVYSLNKYDRLLSNNNVDYIGTRLHGGVYALQHARRTIVICIDHRALGFHETNNLPIVFRDKVGTELEKTINSDFKTEINVDQNAIRLFKEQF